MDYPGTRVVVTGATGFVGAHVTRLLAEAGAEVRVTHRDPERLDRLSPLPVEPVAADVLDRAALRRAFRDARVVFHAAGVVGTRPAERVWQVNAMGPRLAVEAAAAAGVELVVITSSVGGVGPASGRPGTETDVYRGGGLGLTYVDSKHEGEAEALAAGARTGTAVVVVNPAYVLGPPVNRSRPGETSTRIVGNYLRGRLPAVVDGHTNIVHVEDVARGHLLAAQRGAAGERYILGGENVGWVEVLERVAELSGIRRPVLVIPRDAVDALSAVAAATRGLVISPEAFALMAQDWRYSSARAKKELGYRPRRLERTLRETVEWHLELLEAGSLERGGASPLSLGSLGLRVGAGAGALHVLRALERRTGRRLLAAA